MCVFLNVPYNLTSTSQKSEDQPKPKNYNKTKQRREFLKLTAPRKEDIVNLICGKHHIFALDIQEHKPVQGTELL